MPSVDPRAGEIVRHIGEFEASVDIAETALVARDWQRLEQLLSHQHRLTHALLNLLEETREIRPAGFTAELERRIQAITGRRTDQLRRLVAFNHLVKQRLTLISRSRDMRRINVPATPPSRILDTIK